MAEAIQTPTSARILIDGRSGSGKTELADAIADGWPDAQVVHLDDIYPGWHGLAEASSHVHDDILSAIAPRWRRWDWASNTPAEWHALDPSRPMIIEGCGALSRANRTLATFGVWVELGEAARRARAIAREPDFAAHWDEWAEQEQVFIALERPEELADEIVDGTDVLASAAMVRGRANPHPG